MTSKRSSRSPRKPARASGVAGTSWLDAALALLRRREEERIVGDCPLPELYQYARRLAPTLSLGQFHDGLRELHLRGQIHLHPWTGPLYDLPEPTLALLVGHEVAYYASARAA